MRLRVAIIGLDGMSWEVLLKYINFLPTIRNIVKDSYTGLLQCIPPLTPPSWTSIITGVRPNKHGIYGFSKYIISGSSEIKSTFYTSLDVKVPRLSEILAIHDYTSLVVNLPISYPVKGWYFKNHVIVYDILSPKKFIFPYSLSNYLNYFNYISEIKPGKPDVLNIMADYVEKRITGVEKLMDEFSPDFFFTVISETDSAMHRVPSIASAKFDHTYEKILRHVDELAKIVSKRFDIVIFVSDHGLRLFVKAINMSRVLAPIHLSGADASIIKKIISVLGTNVVAGLANYSMVSDRRLYMLSYRIRSFISEIAGKSKEFVDTKNQVHVSNVNLLLDAIDPSDALVIYFNDRKVRDVIYKYVNKYLKKFIIEVNILKDDKQLPALVIIPKEDVYLNFDSLNRYNKNYLIWSPSARHTLYGIFIWWERGKKYQSKPRILENTCIVPNVLARLGLPIPSYSDGTLIHELLPRNLDVSFADYRPKIKVLRKLSKVYKSLSNK